jgi:hypothetical protein
MKMKRKEKDPLKDLTAEDLRNNPSLIPGMAELDKCYEEYLQKVQQQAEKTGE